MNPKPARQFYVPGLGQLPINVNCDADNGPILRGRPYENGNRYIDLLKRLNPAIRRFWDPNDTMPSYAIEKQKIVVLTKPQLESLQNGELSVHATSRRRSWLCDIFSRLCGRHRRLLRSLTSKEALGRITVSDCPAPPDNYSKEPTFTVLLEWTETIANRFPAIELRYANGQLVHLVSEPTNNFLVISGADPNNKPGPPVAAGTTLLNDQASDFKVLTPKDIKRYKEIAEEHNLEGPTVAVVDTGIKFNLNNNNSGVAELPDPYEYSDATNQKREFVLAYKQAENRIGYCSLNAYNQQTVADKLGCKISDIRNSPFDDHRFFGDPGFTTYLDGRHGTSIAAIIQQKANVSILPVKAFDNLGFSTLFDVLNAMNYVLCHKEVGQIYIINASWIFGRKEPLLERKIEQLMRAGIFVIAAAGNRNQTKDRDLDHVHVYPACYSEKYPNVITVTSVTKALSNERHPEAHFDETGLTVKIPTLDRLVAVENFSAKYVNVGVVSALGYFPSPFAQSPFVCGSSFACAHVSAAIATQLRNPPAWMLSGNIITDMQMRQMREQLIKTMCQVDTHLKKEVSGGYYLPI